MFLTLACQPQTNIDSIQLEKQSLENNFISTEIEPLNENDLDGEYLITMKFDNNSNSELFPSAISLCQINEVALKITRDDAILYELITNNELIKENYKSALAEKESKQKLPGFSFECSISFTTPGEYDENCDETCNETSFLGGDTWFCVCLYDCGFEFDWQ